MISTADYTWGSLIVDGIEFDINVVILSGVREKMQFNLKMMG